MAQRPLDGIRIMDFTWAAAGPMCAFLCGVLGAEVIKVETAAKASMDRRPSAAVAIPAVNPDVNAHKKSVTLNLKHPRGLELAKRIAAISDALVDNFRPGVVERLGLGYDVVRGLNPRIVMLSMSAHGSWGPEWRGPGYAAIFAAMGGASHLTGYPDGPPAELRMPIDLSCGTMAAAALLGALYQARTTGQGQYIEVANREVVSSFVGEYLLDAYFNDRDPHRQANRHPYMAPHNVYPCQGEDRWVTIAVENDDEWAALCRALGRPEWLSDPRFADQYQRWQHQDALDAAIAEWTRQHTPQEVAERLQAAGVAAVPTATSYDLVDNPHLRARGVWQEIPIDARPWQVPGAPWMLSDTPTPLTQGVPAPGQHNQEVLCGLLGLSSSELEELVEQGAVG